MFLCFHFLFLFIFEAVVNAINFCMLYIVLYNRRTLFNEAFLKWCHQAILFGFRMLLLYAHWGLGQPLESRSWTTPLDMPLLSPTNARSSCASNRGSSDLCGRSVPASPLSVPRSANRNSLIVKSFTHLRIVCSNIKVQPLLKYI